MICKFNTDLIKLSIVLCERPITYEGYCEEHIPYLLRRKRDYDNTPREKRQKFLDEIWSGKTIGEAYAAAGISFDVACEVMNHAIGDYKYLKKEAE